MTCTLRRARPDEAATLTAIALRAKAHWGYDEAFMSLARADMEIAPELIASSVAIIAERDASIAGFYVLCIEKGEPTLRDLWLEPAVIRSGIGTILWKHVLESARAQGYARVRLVSDPNAAGFYVAMGARRIGEVESVAIKGRMLPALEIAIDAAPSGERAP